MADPVSTATITDPDRVPIAQRFEELEFVAECVRKSDAFRQPYVTTWQEVLDNYMVAKQDIEAMPHIGSPNMTTAGSLLNRRKIRKKAYLKDPETHQIIESLSAQGVGLLLGSKDYLTAEPVGEDDPRKADYLAKILMSVLNQPGIFRTFYQIFKDSFIFGTAIVEIGWEILSRHQITQNPIIEDGVIVGQEFVPMEVPYRNRHLIRQWDIFDTYTDPSGTRIQEDMMYVGKRFRIPAHKARAMAKSGIYLREGVEDAINAASGKNDDDDAEYGGPRRFQNEQRQTNDDYQMLTGYEFYAVVPYKPSDGYRNRVITTLGGRWVRSHINPYLDGNFPVKEVVVNPIAGRFYGLAPGEVVRFIQDSADNLLMVLNDTADTAANNILLMGNSFGGDPNRLRRRGPGDVIRCNDPTAVIPLPVDTNSLQFAGQELMRKKQNMREASGATNPLQSIPTSDRQTATEVSELVRLASQKVELMVQLIEKDDMPWIGRTLHSRMKQFLEPDAEIVLAGEPSQFTLDDINLEADIRFVGSRQAVSKAQKVAALEKAISAVGSNPMMVAMYPELFARYFDELEMPDSERIVQKATEVAMMMQQSGMMDGGQPTRSDDRENFGTAAGETEQQGQRVA